MVLSLKIEALAQYIDNQLYNFFPDSHLQKTAILKSIEYVIQRLEFCFSTIQNKYFSLNDKIYFNHINTDQYSMFLYFLANTLYKNGEDVKICEKIFYLNKALHGIDVFYDVELPDIFLFCHPLGTVLGRAKYSNYFLVYQGCTIGASRESDLEGQNVYPVLGKYCSLYKGASILGNSRVGDNCKISSNSLLFDQNLESNKIYIGTPLSHIVKDNRQHDNIWGRREVRIDV